MSNPLYWLYFVMGACVLSGVGYPLLNNYMKTEAKAQDCAGMLDLQKQENCFKDLDKQLKLTTSLAKAATAPLEPAKTEEQQAAALKHQ